MEGGGGQVSKRNVCKWEWILVNFLEFSTLTLNSCENYVFLRALVMTNSALGG